MKRVLGALILMTGLSAFGAAYEEVSRAEARAIQEDRSLGWGDALGRTYLLELTVTRRQGYLIPGHALELPRGGRWHVFEPVSDTPSYLEQGEVLVVNAFPSPGTGLPFSHRVSDGAGLPHPDVKSFGSAWTENYIDFEDDGYIGVFSRRRGRHCPLSMLIGDLRAHGISAKIVRQVP